MNMFFHIKGLKMLAMKLDSLKIHDQHLFTEDQLILSHSSQVIFVPYDIY